MTRHHTNNEDGIVSLIIVTILAIVLSLIAVGFSKLANRELRQASDRELQTQAYYAAESGLNDAIAYLQAGGETFPGCGWTGYNSPVKASDYFVSDLSPAEPGVAKYSCVSIDNAPKVLKATHLTPGEPQVLKVSAAGLQNLFFGWQNVDYPAHTLPTWLGPTGDLPQDTAVTASTTGLLRVGIYPAPSSGQFTNDDLANLSRSYYLYPNGAPGGAGSIDYNAGSYTTATPGGPGGTNGSFVPGNCTSGGYNPVPANKQAQSTYCNSDVMNLSGNANTYYIYLTAQYAQLSVQIQGTDSSGNPVQFHDSQGVVDVTGQGSGQIQRIRARINLTPEFNYPAYAIQSMETLCKDFTVDITGPSQYGNAQVQFPGDLACQAPSGGGGVVGGGVPGH